MEHKEDSHLSHYTLTLEPGEAEIFASLSEEDQIRCAELGLNVFDYLDIVQPETQSTLQFALLQPFIESGLIVQEDISSQGIDYVLSLLPYVRYFQQPFAFVDKNLMDFTRFSYEKRSVSYCGLLIVMQKLDLNFAITLPLEEAWVVFRLSSLLLDKRGLITLQEAKDYVSSPKLKEAFAALTTEDIAFAKQNKETYFTRLMIKNSESNLSVAEFLSPFSMRYRPNFYSASSASSSSSSAAQRPGTPSFFEPLPRNITFKPASIDEQHAHSKGPSMGASEET